MQNEEGVTVIAKTLALALCLALAVMVAMVGMSSVNVSAAPLTSGTEMTIGGGNGTAATYFGLTTVGWVIAAGAIICLVAFILIRDIRVLIIDAILWVALLVVMYY